MLLYPIASLNCIWQEHPFIKSLVWFYTTVTQSLLLEMYLNGTQDTCWGCDSRNIWGDVNNIMCGASVVLSVPPLTFKSSQYIIWHTAKKKLFDSNYTTRDHSDIN